MLRAGETRPVPTHKLLFEDILQLATFNAELGEIKDAAVFVDGNVVKWVGRTSEVPAEYREGADQIISLKGKVVTPGLVNTHHHMFQSLTRCVAQDSELFGWLTTLYPAWQHLTGEDVYTSSKLAMAELILSGCTCTSDHLYLYPNDVTLDDTIRAARDIGMRFHPTRGAMSLGQSKGGLPPDSICEEEPECLEDMRRCIEEFHDPKPYSMLRMSLAPCAPFCVTDDLMRAAAKLAREYPGVRLHTHLAENQEDIVYSKEYYGCRPGEYIKGVGWDKDDCWFAHCVMLDHKEMKEFAENGIGIAHCPSSNLRLASGICPVRNMLDNGMNVGLGVDGSASSDAGHLLMEARMAMLLQRAAGNPKGLSAREALGIAIKGGAKNLGRTDVGEIAPGFAADFVAWRTDTVNFAGGLYDPVAALVLCTAGADAADYVLINGDIVVQNGKFTTIDLQELVEDHNKRSARICSYIPPVNV